MNRNVLVSVAGQLLITAYLVLGCGATAAPQSGAGEDASSPPGATAETKKAAEPENPYRLDDDQVFKRVGPAYPNTKSARPKLPVQPVKGESFRGGGMIYLQDKEDVRLSQRLLGNDGLALHQLVQIVAGIYPVDVAGDTRLWLQRVQGDFIVRKGSTSEDVIQDVERMINDELHVPVHFEYRDVEREVFVLQGEFKAAPVGRVWRKNPDLAAYVIYGKVRPTPANELFLAAGQFEIFLKAVGTRVGQPVIADAVELPEGMIGWSVCYDEPEKFDWNTFPQHEAKNPDDVVKHVSEQIGYKFARAKKTVSLLFLERGKK